MTHIRIAALNKLFCGCILCVLCASASANGTNIISDNINNQISRQTGNSISESIYGSLVKPKFTVKATAGKITQAFYARNRNLLIQHFSNGAVILWNLKQGEQTYKYKIPDSAQPLGYSPHSQKLFASYKKKFISVLPSNGQGDSKYTSEKIPSDTELVHFLTENAISPKLKLKGSKLSAQSDHRFQTIDNGVAYAVELSNTKFLYMKESGQTYIRKYGADHYLVSMVPSPRGWIVVDHEGRFDGTTQGMKDVTWESNGESMSMDQFFENYFQPGLLSSYLEDGDTLTEVPADIKTGVFLPPKVDLNLPPEGLKQGTAVQVVAVAESRGGDLNEEIKVFHNGKRLPPKSKLATQTHKQGNKYLVVSVFELTATPGTNELYATAMNTQGISARSDVKKQVLKGNINSTMHLVGIGIDEYKNEQLNLDFAVADTDEILGAIESISENSNRPTKVYQISNKKATKRGIIGFLDKLQDIEPNDFVVIAIASHGIYQNDQWYLLPHDLNVDQIESSSISAKALQNTLVNIPAQNILLLIDACNSGGTVEDFNQYKSFQRKFVQSIGRASGVTVLTATRRDQDAIEANVIGHGLFSYTVSQGITGKADTAPTDGNITAHEIAKHVYESLEGNARELNLLRDGQKMFQQPEHFSIGADFLLGRS